MATVAMESTGVYGIPVDEILEARGFKVYLVNARHLKHVPGRKSDVRDCQWIQYLHTCGLLSGSFRPEAEMCAVRAYLRHRATLLEYRAAHIQHIQKARGFVNKCGVRPLTVREIAPEELYLDNGTRTTQQASAVGNHRGLKPADNSSATANHTAVDRPVL